MSELIILDSDRDDDKDSGNIHRIEHTAIIEPGHFWYCNKDTTGMAEWREGSSFKFVESALYLLVNLEFVDGKLHTVVLLDDPTQGNCKGKLTIDMLMANFEVLPDDEAREFRERQMAQIHQDVADVQAEIAESQTNPAVLQPVIEEGLRKWEADLARARERERGEDDEEVDAKPSSNLPALTTNGRFNLSAAVQHKIRSTDVAVFRHMAQKQGKIAEIQGTWIKEKAEKMGRHLQRLTPFMAEHAAVALARAHDQLGLAKDVEKGLASLRLYTGEGVTINPLLKGAAAPSTEPLTLYQRKLFMAEEFAVWADVTPNFDYTHTDDFFKELETNETLRQQLIPAPRGVVSMAIRRSDVKYDAKSLADIINNEARNNHNKALFLLVRNGENWYQVWSDEPSHEVSARLFPTRNEMNEVFRGLDGEQINFDDLRFTNRTKEFDRKSLTYKRFLILACGLDHMHKLFGDFYPDSETFSFISMSFQAKYMRFVSDDDGDVMLGDNVGSVHELIRQNHDQLTAGCRVLVFGRELLQQRAAPGAYSPGSYRTDPSLLVRARSKTNMLTVFRDKGDLVVYLPVERTDSYSYSGWTRRKLERTHFDVRVALNKLEHDRLGYLIADTVKVDELRPFVYNRRSRASHENYLYGFKLAIQLLGEEEAENAPGVALLKDRAVHHYGLPVSAADAAVLSAIQTWREKHSTREVSVSVLPHTASHEFEVLDRQLAETAFSYLNAVPKVIACVEAVGGKVVRITRGKKGMLVAYYEQPAEERDPRIANWQWVGRRTFNVAGKPSKEAPTTVWLPKGVILGETEMHRVATECEFERSEADTRGGSLEELQAMLDKTAECVRVLSGAFKGERQGVSDEAWLLLTAQTKSWASDRNPAEKNEDVLIPIALKTARRSALGLRVKVYDLLYFYGSDAQRAVLSEQGYTLPKLRKGADKKPIPYVGPELNFTVQTRAEAKDFKLGIMATGVSSYCDYMLSDRQYEGPAKLDHSLTLLAAGKLEPERGHFSRKNAFPLDDVWFPPQCYTATGAFRVSEFFPGLPTA